VFGAPSGQGAALPPERYQLGLLLWGLRASSFEEREHLDFYDGKGALESLVHALFGACLETIEDAGLEGEAAYLHPKRRARVRLAGVDVGVLGELHPDVLEAHGLEGRPVYASIDVALLLAAGGAAGPRRAQPLPRFPASTRDLAVVVAEDVAVGDVARALQEAAGALAERVSLFDIYRGAPVPDGKKSLAFHVVYRDPAATLTDKLVDEAHARLSAAAEKRFAGNLR
jgi:phenylalanyl-tRNA synthetase beta chain